MFKRAASIGLLLLLVAACQTTTTTTITTTTVQKEAEVVTFNEKETGDEIKVAESCIRPDQHKDQFCFVFRVNEEKDVMHIGQRYVSVEMFEWMFMERTVAKFNDSEVEYTIMDAEYNDVSRKSHEGGFLEELHLTEIKYSTRATNPLSVTAFLNEQKRRKASGLASDFTLVVYGNNDAMKVFHGE